MSIKAIVSPLYDQYFPREGNQKPAEDWTNFKNKDKDFTDPLSARCVDFSFRDTTWLDHVRSAAQFVFSSAVIFYGVYYFGGTRVQDLAKLLLQALQNSNVQFLKEAMDSNFVARCRDLSGKVFTESILHKGNLIAKAVFYSTTARYILQRIVMIPLYPLQSRIFRRFLPGCDERQLNKVRKGIAEHNFGEWICRDVVLEKNGVRYSGFLVGHKKTINNGNWALQATGNSSPIEYWILNHYPHQIYLPEEYIATMYRSFSYNVLMINGPAIGKNQGQATPKSMGDAQQVGISFLETALKAKNIVIAGRSLGGAAIGQAILQHEFKKDVNYLAVSQMSFDSASNICGKTAGQISSCLEWIVEKLVQLVGCEMDSVAAAKKLQKLGIVQVVVQASHRAIPRGELPKPEDFQTDGPIQSKSSLGHALIEQKITDKKVFICLPNAEHNTDQAIRAAGNEIKKLGVKS